MPKTKKVINLKPIIPKGKKGPPTGTTNNPKGRGKGVQNKITKDIKESFKLLVERNLENMQNYFDILWAEDPAKAYDVLIKLSEFVVPKLARIEGQTDSTLKIIVERATQKINTETKNELSTIKQKSESDL